MVQFTREATIPDPVSDSVGDAADRARSAVDAIAARISDIVDGFDIDRGAIESDVRGALKELRTTECDCPRQVEAAEDEERLKAAVISGVVILILSAAAFVVARAIASRRAEQRRRQATPVTPDPGTTSLDQPADS